MEPLTLETCTEGETKTTEDCVFLLVHALQSFPPYSRRCGIAKLVTARLHLKYLTRNKNLDLIS